MTKCCTKCGETKPTAEFNKQSGKSGGLTSHCKSCLAEWRAANREKISENKKRYYRENLEVISEKKRLYREANRERARELTRQWYTANSEKAREWGLKRRYGIGGDEYDAMLLAQSGVCAICQNECPTGKRLAVDHNHETGEVRGLLCTSCNMGIGKFKENPDIIWSALFYLMAEQITQSSPEL